MRRSLAVASALVLFALALVFSTPYGSRTARASQFNDKCEHCQYKVGQELEKCEAKAGGPTQECYDEFNAGIVRCYATVCEQ